MSVLTDLCIPGRASFIVGGQFGSEGKGAAAAFLATRLATAGMKFNLHTTNAGAQAGHTSIHMGKTRVTNFLPTAAIVAADHGPEFLSTIYLNAGAIINPDALLAEAREFIPQFMDGKFFIHPNAAVITEDCVAVERSSTSPATAISSTRKGVGEALVRKVSRCGNIASNVESLKPFIANIDLNRQLRAWTSVLIEVPQGLGLSLDSQFYPYCTSRNCTVEKGMDDAHIHPHFYGNTMLVLRTYPIRVGSLEGHSSGGCYPDQREISWEELGRKPELTTVTKRQRRVFTFSMTQAREAIRRLRPTVIFLTFCDYLKDKVEAYRMAKSLALMIQTEGLPEAEIYGAWGPTTTDVTGLAV
jgi:adenylosuccinate synthase